MIKSKEVVHLLVFLILNCHSRQGVMVLGSNTYYDQSSNQQGQLMNGQEPNNLPHKHQQQQQQPPSPPQDSNLDLSYAIISSNINNPKKFNLGALELDGNVPRTSDERYKVDRINALLESLSSSIPTQPPTTRTSMNRRRYGLPTATANFDGAAFVESLIRGSSPQTTQGLGISFAPTTTTKQLYQRSQQLSGRMNEPEPVPVKYTSTPYYVGNLGPSRPSKTTSNLRMHPIGTEEVALHTPMHARSVNNFDFKRVENSRWNNLRGMWGKRASPDSSKDFSLNEQQQLHSSKDDDEDKAISTILVDLSGVSGQQQIIDSTKSM